MKKLKSLILAATLSFHSVGLAAVGNFSASGEYLMSDFDTPEIAEQIALDFAKQNAAEQAGIYLESYSKMEKSNLLEDEVKTVASSKVEITEKNISRQLQTDGKILLRADIKAVVDTSELDNFIAQEKIQRQKAIQRYRDLQAMNAKIKSDIETFQNKISKLNDETKDDDFLVEQERINREFLSKLEIENFSKKIGTQILQSVTTDGNLDFDKLGKSYAESHKIENVQKFFQDVDNIAQKSIILNPKNIFAYRLRATIPNGENFKNINQAVILAPENPKVYIDRGELYQILKKDYARAEKDFNKAVELDLKNIESYEKRADFYTKIEKYPQAVEDYTKILQLNPNDIDALRQRAEIYSKLQNYNKAVDDYSKLIKLQPKNVNWYAERAKVYIDSKNFSAAMKDAEKAIKLDPKNYIGYFYRSIAYHNQDKYDKAIENYDVAIDLASKSKYPFVRNIIPAINAAKQVSITFSQRNISAKQQNQPNQPKDELTAKAEEYFDARNYSAAVEIYSQIIKSNPKNVSAYKGRGDCYFLRTDYKDYNELLENKKFAVQDYLKVIKLDPKNSSAYERLAECYQALQDNESALKYINQAIKLTPDNVSLYILRGFSYFSLNEFDGAVKDYLRVIDSLPNSDSNYELLADVYKKIGKYTAVADYEKYISFDSNYEATFEKRRKIINKLNLLNPLMQNGQTHIFAKEYALAVEDYNQIINLESKNYDAYFWRGYCYNELGEYQKALQDFSDLLNVDSYNSSLYNNRAMSYYNLGDYEKALADIERAIEINPDDEDLKNNRRIILETINQQETSQKND